MIRTSLTGSYQWIYIGLNFLLPEDVQPPQSMMGPLVLGYPKGHISSEAIQKLLLSQPELI